MADVGRYINGALDLNRYHAHIICKTIKQGEDICKILRILKVDGVVLVTSNISSSEQKEIASRWFNGEIRVLVSTIIALVGNENPKCRVIIVLDLIFNLASLIQALGRLRPTQRDNNARVIQILLSTPKYSSLGENEYDINNCNDAINQLTQATSLTEDDSTTLKTLFHVEEYRKFVTQEDCLLSRLSAVCGSVSTSDCQRCTWCRCGQTRLDCKVATTQNSAETSNNPIDYGDRNGLSERRVRPLGHYKMQWSRERRTAMPSIVEPTQSAPAQ